MKRINIRIAVIATMMLFATLCLNMTISTARTHTILVSAPTLLWPYGTGGAILDVKSIPDVNGDGKPDVAAGSADNNVYVLDGTDGSKIWNKLTGGNVPSVDYIDDITGDGVVEVVVGSEDTNVYLLNGTTGEEIWAQPINDPFYNPPIYKVQGIVDVTGDGKPDVVAGGCGGGHEVIECKDGTNGIAKWNYDWFYSYEEDDFTMISDVTGDGKPDVVWVFDDDRICLRNGATGVIEEERADLPFMNDPWDRLVKIPDVSGDGYEDTVNIRVDIGESSGARALVLSGPSLEEIWRFEKSSVSTDERMWDANYISDITFDGRPEIVIGWKDKVFLKSGVNGAEIWNTTVTNGNSQYARSHRITEGRDISGDGVDDIVVGVENGKVYILSGEDGASILDPYQIGGSVNSVAYLDDVTGDTVPEILVGGEDHFVYCLTPSTLPPPIDTVLDFWFNPNPVLSGDPCELYGTLTEVGGSPVYPASVDVEYSLDGGTTWRSGGRLDTNAIGEFFLPFNAPAPGEYPVRVSYGGSPTHNPSSDTELLVVEGPLIESWIYFILTPNPTSPGQTVTLRGILVDDSSNPIGSADITIQYSIDHGETWNPALALTTDQYGIFSKTFPAPSAGTYLLKASYAGSPTYLPSSSNAYLVVL